MSAGSPDFRVTRDSPLAHVEDRPLLVLNPGHGNEPYILAAAIGEEIGKRFTDAGMEAPLLVMPLLYGDRQRKIVNEEVSGPASVYYDTQFGDLLKTIMFEGGDYKSHIAGVNGNYDEVEEQINQRYASDSPPATVFNNATQKPREINPRDIIGVIETGNRVSIEKPHKYFAFPEVLSRVLHEAIQHNDELGFDESDMTRLANRMARVESTYSQIFIPWISTFSYQHASDLAGQPAVVDGRPRIYTPPMKADAASITEGVDPGVYVMFSGTASAVESNKALVQAAHDAGIQAYAPPWDTAEGALQLSPSALADPNILAIMGRSGWGTGWHAMQLAKPWLVAEYEAGDDPEIFFNNKTIAALKLGKVLGHHSITAEELKTTIEEVTPGLQDLKHTIAEQFGTNDGVAYVADRIFSDLIR